ncbi:MAG TPA: O-antigen ligase family protein [Thermoleophilaceae bacterium]|nr:O-antigen ligase family protein [Thermoleophilaceae bacterium]
MTRDRPVRLTPAAWALVAAGIVYFASSVGLTDSTAGKTALVLAAFAVLIQLAFTVDPAWLITAAIISTMFAGNWGQLGLDYSIGPHRVILGVALLALLLRAPPARDRPALRFGPVHYVLAAAVIYVVISAIFAGTLGRESGYFGLLDQFGALPFLLFAVAPVAFATDRQRDILLGGLVGTGLYLGVTAILEKLKLNALIWPGYITDPNVGNHFGRARGPFVESGAEGVALYACAVAAAVALLRWRGTWPRLAAWAVLVLAPVGMQLTVTRGVWLAGIAATLVVFATTAELRRYLLPGAVALVVIVLGAFAVIPGLAREASDRQKDKNPIYERQNTNAAGLRMVAAKPILGFGWDRGNENLASYFELHPNIPLVGARAGFHDIYLQYAVTLGVVGVALWLLAAGLAIGGALAGRAPPSVRPWQVGLKALAVAWFVIGLSSPASYVFSTFLFWTWGGIVYGGLSRAPEVVPVSSNGHRNGHRPHVAEPVLG